MQRSDWMVPDVVKLPVTRLTSEWPRPAIYAHGVWPKDARWRGEGEKEELLLPFDQRPAFLLDAAFNGVKRRSKPLCCSRGSRVAAAAHLL